MEDMGIVLGDDEVIFIKVSDCSFNANQRKQAAIDQEVQKIESVMDVKHPFLFWCILEGEEKKEQNKEGGREGGSVRNSVSMGERDDSLCTISQSEGALERANRKKRSQKTRRNRGRVSALLKPTSEMMGKRKRRESDGYPHHRRIGISH